MSGPPPDSDRTADVAGGPVRARSGRSKSNNSAEVGTAFLRRRWG